MSDWSNDGLGAAPASNWVLHGETLGWALAFGIGTLWAVSALSKPRRRSKVRSKKARRKSSKRISTRLLMRAKASTIPMRMFRDKRGSFKLKAEDWVAEKARERSFEKPRKGR